MIDAQLAAFAHLSGGLLCLLDAQGTLQASHAGAAGPWGEEALPRGSIVWAHLQRWGAGADTVDRLREMVAQASTATLRLRHPGGLLIASLQPGAAWGCHCALLLRAEVRDGEVLRERLEFALDAAGMGLVERDLATGAGHWSDCVFAMLGFDPAEGTPGLEQAAARLHEEDRQLAAYHASMRQAGRYEQRYRVVHPDGSERTLHSQWRIIGDEQGRPVRSLEVVRDVTDIAALERSFGTTTEQLRLAIDVAEVGLWRHDLSTGLIHYSPRAFQLMGFEPQADGTSIQQVRDRIHPDDMAAVLASAQHTLQTGQPSDFEARYQRTDGQWRTILSRRVIERNASGEPVAFQGVSMDITEQQEARLRNRELALRLDQSVSAAGIGIWSFDPEIDKAEWNAQMYEIYGIRPDEPLPVREDWLQLVHPDDRPAVEAWAREAELQPGRTFERTYRIRHRSGEWRWLQQRSSFNLIAGKPRFSGVALDVTRRVQAEAALREANDRAALAARSTGMGAWTLDLRSGVARWDAQMFLLRGLDPAGDVPSPRQILAMVHPEDRHLFDPTLAMASIHTGDDAPTLQFRVLRPDGQWRWLASRSTVLRDAQGRPQARVGVNWDVTELKAAERARDEREAALRASHAKSEFLARVSHELRTPLNAVLGFTELLRRELPAQAHAQRMKLDHVQQAGEHLLSLINDVLDLSRLESGTLELALQPVALSVALSQAQPLLEDLRRRQQVRLEAQIDTALHVQADPIRLRQILVNLLSNGIKYNRPGGRVQLQATALPGVVELAMHDEGAGMDADQLAHLFEPFNRLGAQGSGVEGTGIGLVIVKALAEAMGGQVQVQSSVGLGTTVRLRLPQAMPAEGAAATEASAGPARDTVPLLQGRVLYIEDNPVNVLLVQELLRLHTALSLRVATTGSEGVAIALAEAPDLVLVDMQLPDIDGHEVLRQLRADPRGQALPCVALSANAMQVDIDGALRSGFADYWTKPIDFNRFLQALEKRFAQ